tara:strand:+ start:527 stop:670 length:144 start_codon:yes stop_codon:yes gene_type:complete
MKNYDLKEYKLNIKDPVEGYFECISYCDVNDGKCLSNCIEILKDFDN